MDQVTFLEAHVFKGLKNHNTGNNASTLHYFSESDFEIVLKRLEHFGIGMYVMAPLYDGVAETVATHTNFNKKATDARWYKKAFLTYKMHQPGLLYAATYKVSNKLLARIPNSSEEE